MVSQSIIIPVYNRPEEVKELLDSLTLQQDKNNFEVIIVEDGSSIPCKDDVETFARQLNLKYIEQENGGPAKARNTGAAEAEGKYLYFFDSDCSLPSDFFAKMRDELNEKHLDAYGTADTGHHFFSTIQKAISYSMTSIFTTGGIRGSKKGKMDKFYPRSYSMGVSTEVFKQLGGFDEKMRYGEDVDLSMRIAEANHPIGLIESTLVYHRRRATFKSFFKQTFCSGTARIDLAMRHANALKLVHMLPAIGVIGLAVLLWLSVSESWLYLLPLLAYGIAIFVDAYKQFHSIKDAANSVIASAIQLSGYGLGFIYNAIVRLVLRDKDHVAFQKNFYK